MPGSNSETRGRFYSYDGSGSNIEARYPIGSIITIHDRITAMEYVERLGNQVHPMIQTLFPKTTMTMPPFTQLELFSHGLENTKMNFNIFPGQHNLQS
jgi:hypothetical protein